MRCQLSLVKAEQVAATRGLNEEDLNRRKIRTFVTRFPAPSRRISSSMLRSRSTWSLHVHTRQRIAQLARITNQQDVKLT
jgi:hypothetical protein